MKLTRGHGQSEANCRSISPRGEEKEEDAETGTRQSGCDTTRRGPEVATEARRPVQVDREDRHTHREFSYRDGDRRGSDRNRGRGRGGDRAFESDTPSRGRGRGGALFDKYSAPLLPGMRQKPISEVTCRQRARPRLTTRTGTCTT